MRFRTLALALAMGLALTASVEAKKKGPHSTPPTAQSIKKAKKYKPASKGRKIKKHRTAHR